MSKRIPTPHAFKPEAHRHAVRLAQKAKYDKDVNTRYIDRTTHKFTVHHRKGEGK